MQVTCPNCGVRYAVDPLAIGPIGRTVQCARCNHRWREKAATAPPLAAAPPSMPPQPTPALVIRPPTYNSGLPALRTPLPGATWEERWIAAALVGVIALALAAYLWRDDIRNSLPTGWLTAANVETVQGPVKK